MASSPPHLDNLCVYFRFRSTIDEDIMLSEVYSCQYVQGNVCLLTLARCVLNLEPIPVLVYFVSS